MHSRFERMNGAMAHVGGWRIGQIWKQIALLQLQLRSRCHRIRDFGHANAAEIEELAHVFLIRGLHRDTLAPIRGAGCRIGGVCMAALCWMD